jgi:PPOX class probable F420-dependent enzyme
MMQVVPDSFKDLFDKPAFAHLATLMPDGRPQVTPVWVGYDGTHVHFITGAGTQKDKNLIRDGRAAMSILDPGNPYRYMEVRGRVIERTEEGADAGIDALSQRYLGKPYPYRRPGEKFVLFKIEPQHVTSIG